MEEFRVIVKVMMPHMFVHPKAVILALMYVATRFPAASRIIGNKDLIRHKRLFKVLLGRPVHYFP
jgi:hypothetical protein